MLQSAGGIEQPPDPAHQVDPLRREDEVETAPRTVLEHEDHVLDAALEVREGGLEVDDVVVREFLVQGQLNGRRGTSLSRRSLEAGFLRMYFRM
jgi:hypothetical protein